MGNIRHRFEIVIGRFLGGFGGLLFFLLAGNAFISDIVSPWMKYLCSGNWEQAQCVIVSPEDHTWPTRSYSEDFLPRVYYRYEWEGSTHYSFQIGFATGRTWGDNDSSRFERDNQPGTIRFCWVNPDDPAEAVLIRKISYRYFNVGGLVMLVFTILSGLLFIWCWFGWLFNLDLKRPYRKIGYFRGR